MEKTKYINIGNGHSDTAATLEYPPIDKYDISEPESYHQKFYIVVYNIKNMPPEYIPKKEETGKSLEEKTYTEKQNFEDEVEPWFGTHIREAVKAFKDFYRELRTDITKLREYK